MSGSWYFPFSCADAYVSVLAIRSKKLSPDSLAALPLEIVLVLFALLTLLPLLTALSFSVLINPFICAEANVSV